MSQDQQFMQRALELAESTTALASPNPQVGCVFVRDGKIIAEGFHLYEARDHAEIAALKQAEANGIDVAGDTAYVTLEPCSHHGRTGPCADVLIAAGISRCVIATLDANPVVRGNGVAKLEAAGIAVTVGVLEQKARTLNDAFAWSIRHNLPMVTLKAALSVDGKLAPPPSQRQRPEPHWLTGPESRAEVQRLRHASDAILTGIGTVLADDPTLTDRTGLPRRRPLQRIILDAHLRIPVASKLVESAADDLLIFCNQNAPQDRLTALEAAGAEIHQVPGTDRLDLRAILSTLHERKLLSVLLEAGPSLNGAFLAAHLVQRAILFYADTELGEGALPFAEDLTNPHLLEQTMTHVTRTTFGPDGCVSGLLQNPWE
ncbi:bifunctional diaminohydroxyphosphoribosylaminopyrimidine deaminase/5-amino-6-(5-phosphoribosylamino)uracil reductase RibD [Granulicella tundricola]|uniref:Riboflavin biosynthesis protein RibD n=1 Tax=Granulicella tundricola (strain ATCC BAA-1859 / DSM 23138 / MP5ACTX9) TaxID=1198114 RepID=E8X2C9_GRATM|nr:bifunctional diaminohydroxyphosphoribosylaminopyrimidine deaminase/5-amino-6-(5-phosphoribosylamino)uracil reductase RibD [Granulicella tundricola]ADW68061.1 riboflavin biosynthesis protein RibD [Granulicella tundricola MP5ACTX9]